LKHQSGRTHALHKPLHYKQLNDKNDINAREIAYIY